MSIFLTWWLHYGCFLVARALQIEFPGAVYHITNGKRVEDQALLFSIALMEMHFYVAQN
jgi:hypothetical protein